jgi:hypothetical protein
MDDERNVYKPAAAWSRDSLTAWQWMADNTQPLPSVGADPQGCHTRFLRRWAVKILILVNVETGWSDWYWFLYGHFEKELLRMSPGEKPLRDYMFTKGSFDNDPVSDRTEPVTLDRQ